MSVPSNREFHYKNLRDRYTNCTYVDGNLEITWIQNSTVDLSFLQHIREVTGYVLISHVDTEHIRLPRLQIIRGRTLFKLNVWNSEFGLFVSFSQAQSLELPALRDILNGSVGMFNNYNLCHIRTIEWDEIISGENLAKPLVVDGGFFGRLIRVLHAFGSFLTNQVTIYRCKRYKHVHIQLHLTRTRLHSLSF